MKVIHYTVNSIEFSFDSSLLGCDSVSLGEYGYASLNDGDTF
jgi:hypothetical protein